MENNQNESLPRGALDPFQPLDENNPIDTPPEPTENHPNDLKFNEKTQDTIKNLAIAILCLSPTILWIFTQMGGAALSRTDYTFEYFAEQEGLHVSFKNLSVCDAAPNSTQYQKWQIVQKKTSAIDAKIILYGLPMSIVMTFLISPIGANYYKKDGHRFRFIAAFSTVQLVSNTLVCLAIACQMPPDSFLFLTLLVLNAHIIPRAISIPVIFQQLHETFTDQILWRGNIACDLLAYAFVGIFGKLFSYFTSNFWIPFFLIDLMMCASIFTVPAILQVYPLNENKYKNYLISNHPKIYKEKFDEDYEIPAQQIAAQNQNNNQSGNFEQLSITERLVKGLNKMGLVFKKMFIKREGVRRFLLWSLFLVWLLNGTKYAFEAVIQYVLMNKPFCMNNYQIGNLSLISQSTNIGTFLVGLVLPTVWLYQYINITGVLISYTLVFLATGIIEIYFSTVLTSLFAVVPVMIRTQLAKVVEKEEYGIILNFFYIMETILIGFAMALVFAVYGIEVAHNKDPRSLIFGSLGVPTQGIMLVFTGLIHYFMTKKL